MMTVIQKLKEMRKEMSIYKLICYKHSKEGESWTDCIRNLKEVLETIVLDNTSEIEIKFEKEGRDEL